ncbi:class I SAM-dependent methyltransferase [Micromonospora sp. NPDC049048]|uniref:class I SAM-dependent methyltransferase n=1 Tax=Micromonospora sp. NPDC049048 TaxID=3364263 RepID=UPI0037121260
MTERGQAAPAPVTPAELIDRARRANLFYRASYEGTDPNSVRLPGAAVDELVQGLVAGVHHELCQIVPYSTTARPADPFSRAVFRQLAQRATVRRVYLVPGEDVGLTEVHRQLAEDNEHNLDAVTVPVSIAGEFPSVPMTDMWLIDRQVVVRQEVGRDGLASWVVSGHSEDVARARRLWDDLLCRSRPTGTAPPRRPGPELTRWLLESAKMLYAMAPMSCGPSYLDEVSCSWYHRAWQYLRLFDMVSSPQWHADFYARHLADAVRAGARRVLISGTADYTTLAFVFEAVRSAIGGLPEDLDVHVLDRCQTPLLACHWYAQQIGARVQVHQADVTCPDEVARVAGQGPFDLVVADAFLTRFTRASAGLVIGNWAALLRPGGSVVTTVRLHNGNEWPSNEEQDGRHRVTDLIDDFELRFRERAAGWRALLPVELEELSDAARHYARRMASHDLGDAEDVVGEFARCGFRLSGSDVGDVDGELVRTQYLRLRATLRDDSGGSGG